jgi:hypothetical protein
VSKHFQLGAEGSTANPKVKFFFAIQIEPISDQVIQFRFEAIPFQDRLHLKSLKGRSKIDFFPSRTFHAKTLGALLKDLGLNRKVYEQKVTQRPLSLDVLLFLLRVQPCYLQDWKR